MVEGIDTDEVFMADERVSLIASDIVKQDLAPRMGDFAEANGEFFVSTYAALRNPKSTLKKQIVAITL